MPELESEQPSETELRLAAEWDARRASWPDSHVHMARVWVDVRGEPREGVLITHGATLYTVVPVESADGSLGLAHYAETALSDVLDDVRPTRRDYLARLAQTFLDSDRGLLLGQGVQRFRHDTLRPNDATLLRIVRRALAAGVSPRRELRDTYGVSIRTADDWISYARKLPEAADLPPARRGRPRKQPIPLEESER